MATRSPPVPPANRSKKGPGSDPRSGTSDLAEEKPRENFDQQGRTANTKQNTVNHGSHGKHGR